MKKSSYAFIAVTVIVGGLGYMGWQKLNEYKPDENSIEPAAGQPAGGMPLNNATTPPPVQVAQAPAATAPATATPSATKPPLASEKPVVVEAKPSVITPGQGAPTDLQDAMQQAEFQKVLSFPLNEKMMIAFARAAIKVQKINSKWDIQISSAESDAMAIEYTNFAVEEITTSLKNIPDLTLAQYNELTQMTIDSKEFNSIYLAYKQLVSEGAFGPEPKADPVVTAPTPAAVEQAKPASAPVNSGNTPAPQGSTTLPGSQPVSR